MLVTLKQLQTRRRFLVSKLGNIRRKTAELQDKLATQSTALHEHTLNLAQLDQQIALLVAAERANDPNFQPMPADSADLVKIWLNTKDKDAF